MATNKDTTKKATSRPAPEHVAKAANIRREVGQGRPDSITKQSPLNALATTYKEAMTSAKNHFEAGFQALTTAVALKDLTPPELASVHDYAKSLDDALSETTKLARARVLSLCLEKGQPVGDSGKSREIDLGNGMVQRITIQKSGTDPKKFEAALRAKSVAVAKYMDTVMTFKLKDGTGSQDLAVADGVFTPDELKALEYEETYRVDRTKEAKP
jgi:hypothetical protein